MMRNVVRVSILSAVLAAASHARGATITLSLPALKAPAGTEIEVPIAVKNAKGMSALQVLLTYDPTVLEAVSDADRVMTRGKIVPENAMLHVYTDTPGRMPVLFLGGADKNQGKVFAVDEDGTLVTIRFRVIGGEQTALKLEKAQAFEASDMDMLVKTEDGNLTVGGLPWWWYLGAIPVVLLLLALLLRKRKKPAPVTAPATPRGGDEELVAVPLDEPGKHTCVSCGRVITIPETLGGKMFKCPGCGTPQQAAAG